MMTGREIMQEIWRMNWFASGDPNVNKPVEMFRHHRQMILHNFIGCGIAVTPFMGKRLSSFTLRREIYSL
jgi:hypothetical protein